MKEFKPITPSTRGLKLVNKDSLWKGSPLKILVTSKNSKAGRNNYGHITVRRRGGGHKQSYRLVDFKRSKYDVLASVERIEYDPNRTAYIALIKYSDGIFSYIITVCWIIGITNAINLIDGLDGLSSGVTLISCLSLLMVFALNGSPLIAIVLITALAGAIVGFLPFNFNPAKTFIGDTGSNFMGFSLAIISILGVAKTYTALVLIAPIIILAMPIFDTLFTIIRRIIKGKSLKAVFKPDKGHLHHKLVAKGYTQKQAVLIMYGITATLGMFAVILLESGIWKALSFALLIIAIVTIGYKDVAKLMNDDEDIEEKKLNKDHLRKQE